MFGTHTYKNVYTRPLDRVMFICGDC